MKKTNLLILIGLLSAYTNAHAWFFFFIPGSAVRGVSDAITGAKGDICVKDSVKVGDVIPSIAGNKMTILSTSGTSSICTNPATPIRADVQFDFTFKSNAGINLSDDYEPKSLLDLQRYNGTLLIANSKTRKNTGVNINSREKKPNSDPQALASNLEKIQSSVLIDSTTKNSEQLTINGLNAWRFEVHGKLKGVFGPEVVYLITVLEGANELMIVNAYSSKENFERDKDELRGIAFGITGIAPTKQEPIDTSKQQDQ